MLILIVATVLFIAFYSVWRKDFPYLTSLVLFFPIVITIVLEKFTSENKAFQMSILVLFYALLIAIKQGVNTRSNVLYYSNPTTIAIIAFYLILLFHDFFISPYFDFHRKEIISSETVFLTNILLPYMVVPLLLTSQHDLRSFANSITTWSVVLFLAFVAVYGFNPVVLTDRMLFDQLSDGVMGPIAISRTAALFVLISFFKIFNDSSRPFFEDYGRMGNIILFLIACFMLFVAGQRGTIIGVMLGLVTLSINKAWRKKVIPFILLFVVALFVLSFFNFEVVSRFEELNHLEKFARYRDYGNVYQIFNQNDFFWGLGTDGYHYYTGNRPYPHNIILQHISDYGLLGLICISVIIYQGAKYSIYIVRHSTHYSDYFFACAWVTFLFSALVSSNITAHRHFYVITGFLVLIYNGMKKHTFHNNPATV